MDELEAWANWVNDLDSEWWPFLFLRPEPHERMTSVRVALLAVLYGGLVGSFADALVAIAGKTVNPWAFPAILTVILFVGFRATMAFCWNRRAARITRRD